MGAKFAPEDRMTTLSKDAWKLGLDRTSLAMLTEAQIVGQIGRRLGSIYQDVFDGPLPEELAALVRQLEIGEDQSGLEQGGSDARRWRVG